MDDTRKRKSALRSIACAKLGIDTRSPRWLYILEVFRGGCVHIVRERLRFTNRAVVIGENTPLFRRMPPLSALQDRWLTLLEAGSTEIMRGFALTHRSLQRVHHTSRKRSCQLIALLLSIPIFHACDLAFQFSYALNQRRLRHICGENLVLGVDDLLIKLDGFRLNISHRFQAYEGLRNLTSRLQAADSGRNACHIHD